MRPWRVDVTQGAEQLFRQPLRVIRTTNLGLSMQLGILQRDLSNSLSQSVNDDTRNQLLFSLPLFGVIQLDVLARVSRRGALASCTLFTDRGASGATWVTILMMTSAEAEHIE